MRDHGYCLRIRRRALLFAGGLLLGLACVEGTFLRFAPRTVWDYRFHPVLGVEPAPNARFLYQEAPGGSPVLVTFNSRGRRNVEGGPILSSDSVIMILGDSFSEAMEVPLEEIYFRRMDRALRRARPERSYRFVNLARGGMGTLEEVYRFQESLERGARADFALLLYFGNDVCDNARIENLRVENGAIVGHPMGPAEAAWTRFRIAAWRTQIGSYLDDAVISRSYYAGRYDRCRSDSREWRTGEERTEAALGAFRRLCQSRGIRPFVVLAHEERKIPPAGEIPRAYKSVTAWAHREKVPLLDLAPALREEVRAGRAISFRTDPHWTSAGHEVAAREITEFFLRLTDGHADTEWYRGP